MLDKRSGEWDFGPNFSPETYSDQQIDYHVPDLDHDRYKIIPDGRFVGANRRSRSLLDNEGPFFFPWTLKEEVTWKNSWTMVAKWLTECLEIIVLVDA